MTLGLNYPLVRGVALLLVALPDTVTLGESWSPLAWAGILGNCCGVLVLGLRRQALHMPKAVVFTLTNAVIIATYTVCGCPGSADLRQCVAVHSHAISA